VVDDEAAPSKSEEAIGMAMIDAMWHLGENASGNPELEFSASGRAKWFRPTDWAKFDYVS